MNKNNSQPDFTQKIKQIKDFRITTKTRRENKEVIVLESFSVLKEEEEPNETKSYWYVKVIVSFIFLMRAFLYFKL